MKMRIIDHPLLEFKRGKNIFFTVDGKKIPAFEGETIAAALHAAGIRVLRKSILHSRPRGFFCAIGKCASCMMTVDGIPNVKTCVTMVEQGMMVESQERKGRLNLQENPPLNPIKKMSTQIAVVGAGPAGLSAAVTAQKYGASVLAIDENPHVGGQLVKQTHKFFGSSREQAGTRGTTIATMLHEEAREVIMEQAAVIGWYTQDPTPHSRTSAGGHLLTVKKDGALIELRAEKVIIATGASERMVLFENNDLPGVYGAGAVQTLMNVYGITPGKRVLMVGAGNVGLIVAYQLLQAGVEVVAVVEALPHVGGYHVHAAKIRRCGVPIHTATSIIKARGEEVVTGAVTVSVDETWNPIPGTEKEYEVDVICLAVGLSPSVELFHQAGCTLSYIPELGGHVPLHDRSLETTVEGIYAAGDAAGIGEANTAMMEGKIAALSCLESLGLLPEEASREREQAYEEIHMLRSGSFGERPRQGKEKLFAQMEAFHVHQ
jgi:sarcosine oxidase subunit alpha